MVAYVREFHGIFYEKAFNDKKHVPPHDSAPHNFATRRNAPVENEELLRKVIAPSIRQFPINSPDGGARILSPNEQEMIFVSREWLGAIMSKLKSKSMRIGE